MTEQPQTISRARITAVSGSVDRPCLVQVRGFLGAFLDLVPPDGARSIDEEGRPR